MTFEQLSIFVAVAERQHLTRAAAAIGLTPSAVSASIKTLEGFYNVRLFERVGRGIELTQTGRVFLEEAKATLARAQAAERVLGELGGLQRGRIDVHASQTVASYWLPPRLMRFHDAFPRIDIRLSVGNTRTVIRAVAEGAAEIGFIEGSVDEPSLAVSAVAEDHLVVVVAADHPLATAKNVALAGLFREVSWVMREEGSGTRSEFEAALAAEGCDPSGLNVVLTFPSNEAVLSATRAGRSAAAVSRIAAAPLVDEGALAVVDVKLPPRTFMSVRHKERHLGAAGRELMRICAEGGDGSPAA